MLKSSKIDFPRLEDEDEKMIEHDDEGMGEGEGNEEGREYKGNQGGDIEH